MLNMNNKNKDKDKDKNKKLVEKKNGYKKLNSLMQSPSGSHDKAEKEIQSLKKNITKEKQARKKSTKKSLQQIKRIRRCNQFFVILCVTGNHPASKLIHPNFGFDPLIDVPISFEKLTKIRIPFFLLANKDFDSSSNILKHNTFGVKSLFEIYDSPMKYLFSYKKAIHVKKNFASVDSLNQDVNPALVSRNEFDNVYQGLIDKVHSITSDMI